MMQKAAPPNPAILRTFRRDECGATAVEFGLIAMLLFIVSFGIIDFGLAYWQWVSAEKATQIGVRMAVVSDLVAPCLANLTTGNTVTIHGTACTSNPASAAGTLCMSQTTGTIIADCNFTAVTCTNTACTPSTYGFYATAFTAIYDEMKQVDPYIAATDVKVTYSPNGLGFVGRPNGLPVTVTVTLTGMTFKFLVIDKLLHFGGKFKMPPFNATLVGEDLSSS